MDRERFKKMTDVERVEWFNAEYSKGFEHSKILKKYNLARNTVSDTFKRNGYIYNKNKYIYEMSEQKQVITENKQKTNITTFNEKKENIRIDLDIQKDLMKMIDWYRQEHDEIRDVLSWYKEFKDTKDIIELPNLEIDELVINGEIKTRSFTINENLLKMFNDFSKNKPFSKQDLLGQAILEFVRKYGN